ncbi:MAG: TldD/PmbA family protein [Euryarchaeota archaeon]|nr:TldD/PmbA family protein [Euryarchaeota archaeon]
MFEQNDKIMKIAKKMGFGDVAILSRESERTQVRFANGDISISKKWLSKSTEIFVEKDKRIAGTELSVYDEATITRILESLNKVIKGMSPKEDYYGLAEPDSQYPDIPETYDPKILNADPAELAKAGIDATGLERVAGVLYTDHNKIYLSTSNGAEAMDQGTGIEISIRAFKDPLSSGHATSSARVLSKFNPEKAGEKAGEIAKAVSDPVLGEPGKYEVIFDPLAIGNLLSMMGRFTSAMAVEAGFSFLMGKIGQKVATENFTFRDIGNLPNGYGTRKFDAEGVATRNTAIIENGVLKTYLLNHSYAKKYNMENTANAGIVSPGPWNLYVEPGDYKKDEIFDVSRAIYITNIWYTRFQNYVAGDFSTIPRDGIFLIENGEIKGALKNIRISDNVQRMLENISAIGNAPEQIHWWECEIPVFTPYIRISDVGITRATQ